MPSVVDYVYLYEIKACFVIIVEISGLLYNEINVIILKMYSKEVSI